MPDHGHGVGFFAETMVVVIALGAVLCYLLAASHPRRGGRWPRRRSLYWVLGVTLAAASVTGPLVQLAHADLRWHMVTHLLIGMIAPLLLVRAAPVTLALRSLELTPARRLSRLLRSAPLRLVSHPVTATVLSAGGLWVLYATDLFAVAHEIPVVMSLVMTHLLASGYLVTAALVGVDPDPHRASAPVRLALLALAVASHEVLARYLYLNLQPAAEAETAAQLMSYGGDAVHVLLIALVLASWPALRVRGPAPGAARAGRHGGTVGRPRRSSSHHPLRLSLMTGAAVLGSAAVVGPVAAPALHVMSFNIRRRMPHLSRRNPDRWRNREPLIARLLTAERPALLGVQEAMPDQEDAVLDALGAPYRSVGLGRKPGHDGERTPLFYDSARLELLDWRQLALSSTPQIAGSTGWGNWIPRVAVRAEFRDTGTGHRFLAVNTHLDHLSRAARLASAHAIRDLVAGSQLPAVVTGDFNTDAGTRPYRTLTAHRRLADTWRVAAERLTPDWGSFPNYRKPRRGAKRIDWILTTPTFAVFSAAINVTRYDGDWPSDHAPVQAVVRLGGS